MRAVRFLAHPSVSVAESDDDTSSFVTADHGEGLDSIKSTSSEVWKEVILDGNSPRDFDSSGAAPDTVLFISAGTSQAPIIEWTGNCFPVDFRKVELNTVQLPSHLKGRLTLRNLQAFITDLRVILESTNSSSSWSVCTLPQVWYSRSKRRKLICSAIVNHNGLIAQKGIEWQLNAPDETSASSPSYGVITITLREKENRTQSKSL